MKRTKNSLLFSAISLLLCISMLLGTTYAWFTDSVTSNGNRIVSGTLDVEMYWSESLDGPWHNIEEERYNTIFNYDKWEPGYTELRYIKIVNKGNLALKYQLSLSPAGTVGKLAEVIDVYFSDSPTVVNDRAALLSETPVGTLNDVIAGISTGMFAPPEGMLLPAGTQVSSGTTDGTAVCSLALHMQENAGNEYQGETVGEGFFITLVATQASYESDSFDEDYDEDASFPALNLPVLASAAVTTDNSGVVTQETAINEGAEISAVVSAGTKLEAGTDSVTLTVKLVSENGNINATDGTISRTLDVHVSGIADDNTQPVIVTIENALPINMNLGAINLYHTENSVRTEMTKKTSAAEVTAHNDFYYNSVDGSVIMALKSFSEILFEVDEANPWDGETATPFADGEGTKNDPYMIYTADQLAYLAQQVNAGISYSDKFFKLGKDIVLNTWDDVTDNQLSRYNDNTGAVEGNKNITAKGLSKYNDVAFEQQRAYTYKDVTCGEEGEDHNYLTWTPIGNGSNEFSGTFDGNNHYVSGLFKLWYKDPMESSPMGLFGWVHNGTVKNLTVKDSFIYTYGGTVGLVSAYASGNTSFENVQVKDNFVTSYNYPLGGILGMAWQANADKDASVIDDRISFTNVTIDNSNLLEALWGTYDSSIGGIVGTAYPDTVITFNNVTSWPEMSLYNDCCANYQWFAYRYSGMLIGYVRASDRADYLANRVHCTDVVVKYGSWTDMYYCELVSNGHPSYCEPHDWKYSRIDISELTFNETTKKYECNHKHSTAGGRAGEKFTFKGVEYTYDETDEDNCCVCIPFNQLFGGGQGVYGENLEKYKQYCSEKGVDAPGVIENNSSPVLCPLGHTWPAADADTGIEWEWTGSDEGGYTAAKLTITCSNCGNSVDIYVANDDENDHRITSTVTADGTVYTATVTYDGVTYTGTKLVAAPVTTFALSDDLVDKVDKYLVRVGNMNDIPVNKLFKRESGDVDDAYVTVSCTTISSGTVGFTYTQDTTDWTNGTVRFRAGNTGVVQLTLKYKDEDKASLYLEVVDAVNLTSVTSISDSDAVLLSDCGVGETTYTISNGRTLYGNGFTISSMNVGVGKDASLMSAGYISLNNGNLENVRIVCAIYPRGYMYSMPTSKGEAVMDSNNKNPLRSETDKDRYNYQYSAVAITGKSSISNCYIEGARNNIIVNPGASGSVINNTTLAYGSLANIHIMDNSGMITIRDLTTIQDVVRTNLPSSLLNDGNHNNDGEKTVFGLGILVGNNESTSYPTIKIEGTFKQYNWIKKGTTVSSSVSNTIISTVFNNSSGYQKTIDGDIYVNIGIVYMTTMTPQIDDSEFEMKSDYLLDTISVGVIGSGQTYSYIGTADSSSLIIPDYEYAANEKDLRIDEVKLRYNGANDYTVVEEFNAAAQSTIPTIRTEVGEGESKQLAVNDIVADRMGERYHATGFTVNGEVVAGTYVINCSKSELYTIGVSGTTDGYYNKYGQFVSDVRTFDLNLRFIVVSNAIERPELFFNTNYDTYNNKFRSSSSDWTGVWKALNDVEVRYFSKSRNCYVQVPLNVFTPSSNGKLSNGSSSWTGTYDDCTLTLTSTTKIHDGKSDYGYFIVSNGEMYLTCSNNVGSGTSSRVANIKYEFVDCNQKQADPVTKRREVVRTAAANKSVTSAGSQYYLRLDPGAGTVSPNEYGPKSRNSNITLPTPTLDGYQFLGWFDQPTGGTQKSTSYTTTASNVVLFAHWLELTEYTVTLDSDGGYCDESQFISYSGVSHELPTVYKDGYWLEGWFEGSRNVGMPGDTYVTPSNNVTLKAHWSPKYTVTYNANGGTVSPASATYEGTALTMPKPTNGAKTFEGWFTAAEGGTLVGSDGDSYTPTANIELFAHWSNNIKVTFNGNGGTAGTNSATYDNVTPISLPTATWAGHQFNGWYTAASGGTKVGNAGASYVPTEPTTLYAQWTAYTVTYNANEGSVSPASARADSNGKVTLPTPTRTGYDCSGWYTAASGGVKYGSCKETISLTENVTLYAQWTQQKFTVTIEAGDGGSVSPKSIANVPYGTTVTVSKNTLTINGTTVTATASSGYSFNKWDISNGATITSAKTIKASFNSCVVEGTLITLADGTRKAVEDLTMDDMLLVWNLETGEYDIAPMVFIDSDPLAEYTVMHVCFSDGSDVGVVSEHGFFDLDLGKYVYISEETMNDYVGHRFVKESDIGNNTWEVVTLTDVWTEQMTTTVYSPVTAVQLCYFTNGMLSMPGGIEGLFNIFDVDTDTMTYDAASKQSDIDTYGLLTIEDYGGMITEDMFYVFNGQYLGIAVGKGQLTWEYITYLAERYAPLCE